MARREISQYFVQQRKNAAFAPRQLAAWKKRFRQHGQRVDVSCLNGHIVQRLVIKMAEPLHGRLRRKSSEQALPGVPKGVGGNPVLESGRGVAQRGPASRILQGNLVFVPISGVAGTQFIVENTGAKQIQMRQIKTAHDAVDLGVAELHHLVMFQKVAVFWRKRVERTRRLGVRIVENCQKWKVPVLKPGVRKSYGQTIVLGGGIHALAGINLPRGAVALGGRHGRNATGMELFFPDEFRIASVAYPGGASHEVINGRNSHRARSSILELNLLNLFQIQARPSQVMRGNGNQLVCRRARKMIQSDSLFREPRIRQPAREGGLWIVELDDSVGKIRSAGPDFRCFSTAVLNCNGKIRRAIDGEIDEIASGKISRKGFTGQT